MNKTVNINLGGMFFHIDEDAYLKLTRYFDAIKRSLNNSSGQDEIIKDIEMRVSELLTEKQKSEKHVVGLKDVDEVIVVMGQPEDYIIEDDTKSNQSFNNSATRKNKKLYRDKENGMIGGVATGLGHYFGIEAVWIKVLFLIFVFAGFGTGILAYFVLWIVTPEAVTTSEKLEMTGEPVTISNIERKVREEIESLSDRFKNADYDQMGNQVKSGAERISSSFGDFIMTVFKIFAKFLGVILIMAGITTLILLLIGVFTLGTNIFIDFPWQNFVEAGNFTEYPIWSFGLLMFFAVGIPFFFLTLLGFKLLAPNIKTIGNIAKYTLLAVWIISVAIAISIGIKQATEISHDNKSVEKKAINITAKDTLYVKFRYNDYFAKDLDHHGDFEFVQDSANNQLIYSTDVRLHVLHTDEATPYLQIEKSARGNSLIAAKQRAEKINYKVQINGNHLVLDNYFLTDVKNKFRGQEVDVYLYLPEGQLFKPDTSVQDYDNSDDSFFNLHFSGNYIYKVQNSNIKCLNCPEDENEYNDVEEQNDIENDTVKEVSIKINGKEVLNGKKSSGKLTTDKNGVIIKIN
ncbi:MULTISPECIES: PspC domain-containing protein [Flavobacterium]|uniref:PspC domain-containing protein n=2 Tax=Flavobacterium TaxID=237 RepID=A0A940X6X0_9FLAO|nr:MULTISPECIES: PspC domain-containing protein [Flavobacterium]MBP4139353.1 PspC domain-containing protein [Flavobacterium geliluteum]MDX6182339.1 PspC domain-containing protein [Flavobacterium sp. Fl-33]MDX6185748.1 PspC domain-containing protein [Flavobacterium sp. Fl-77]UFH38930.1 PspC domain-containing protein [Flavobacterium sp. F-70]